MIHRRQVVIGLAATLGAPSVPSVWAQSQFPSRNVRFIVPFSAGGPTDVVARLIGDAMSTKWSVPVVVENKPGAGTLVGSAEVARSQPDGYTLGFVVSAHTINPAVRKKMPYDTLRDFRGITELAEAHVVLVANASFPADDFGGFLKAARAAAEPLAYATPGAGTSPHLAGALLEKVAGIKMLHGNDVISYARLVFQMGVIARRAMSLGLERGSVVALSIEQPLLHSVVILGLTQAGIITVSVAGHKPPAGLKVDAVISSGPYPFAPEARHFILDLSWMTSSGGPIETWPSGSLASNKTCRIVLTSGTTGDPKAVAMTHDMVMARNARYEYVIGSRFSSCSRLYMNMGLAAALGFQFLIYFLGRGGTLFFHGDSVENTLRSFEIFRIEAMLATPAMLARLLATCDQHPSIEVQIATIISSGGLLPRALLERVRPRLCSHIITGYGSTEAALSATAPAHQIAHIPGAAGYVTPGIRIEIVDAMERAVPAGVEGIVRISSDFGIDGYIDDPVESALVFRDGWFYPGDLGSLTSENLLIISGRQNAVLNAGGGKMSAERVEAALLSCKGVREAAVFMATSKVGVEEVWAGIVTSETVDAEGVRAHCRSLMPAVFVPVHIVPLDRLPVNATGKVDRRHLKDQLLGVANS